ncbi:MAG TPA: ribbon-helix-helix protein, CopG family [Thermoanaerobaculia bacterium]|nr:ribbon-helix-helix protein, CopG family [Thermoanaerobaculia bacterium]
MDRTTIMLPPKLKREASSRAEQLGISLSELIRRSLEQEVAAAARSSQRDPLFADAEVFEGETPADLALRHDDYLYGR